jgi:hypothetical protein
MALEFEKLSTHLRDILLNLKHMSPMRRFSEMSRPRFELNWQTLAFRYGIEKLEAQGWVIPDQEILNPKSTSSPLISTDDTDQQENQDSPQTQRTQSTQSTERQAAEEDPEVKQVYEEVNADLAKMPEAAAMETERTPMPENHNDKEAVKRRDDEIWRQAYEYTESTLRRRIELDIRRQVGAPMPWEPQEDRAEYHRRQLAKLTKADAAPRCEHIYTDGTTCGSPRLKNGHWCYAHERMKSVRVTRLRLLPMEDGNSIMLNLMEIQRALVEGEISERTAGLLMYNQQLALIGLKGITFRETDAGQMVRELPKFKTRLPQRTRRARRNRVIGKSKTHHGGAETRRRASSQQRKAKTLPLMNADDADFKQNRKTGLPQRRRRRTSSQQHKAKALPLMNPDHADSKQNHAGVIPGDERRKSFRFGDGGDEGRGEGVARKAGLSPRSHDIARRRRHREFPSPQRPLRNTERAVGLPKSPKLGNRVRASVVNSYA